MTAETLHLEPINLVDATGLAGFAHATEPEHAQALTDAATAAAAYVETAIGQPLVERTRRATLGNFPADDLSLGLPDPATQLLSVKYQDGDQQTVSVDVETLTLIQAAASAAIKPDVAWPVPASKVTVTYITPPPPQAMHAVRLLAAYWFEVREAASDRRVNKVPHAVDALILQLRGVLLS
jgi:uncharacterized phiE125 gp8 family phage protein